MGNTKSLDTDAGTLVHTIADTDFTFSYADLWEGAGDKWELLAELETPFDNQFGPTRLQYDGEYLTITADQVGPVVLEVGKGYHDEVRDTARSIVNVMKEELRV